MKKKILLAVIGILMLTIYLTGGAEIPTLYKNYIQFASFAGIAMCVHMVMRDTKKENLNEEDIKQEDSNEEDEK